MLHFGGIPYKQIRRNLSLRRARVHPTCGSRSHVLRVRRCCLGNDTRLVVLTKIVQNFRVCTPVLGICPLEGIVSAARHEGKTLDIQSDIEGEPLDFRGIRNWVLFSMGN